MGPGIRRSVSCASGKRRYSDRIAALLVLAQTQRFGGTSRAERRVYQCPVCRGWHLTSRAEYSSPRLGEVRPVNDVLRGRDAYQPSHPRPDVRSAGPPATTGGTAAAPET